MKIRMMQLKRLPAHHDSQISIATKLLAHDLPYETYGLTLSDLASRAVSQRRVREDGLALG